VGGCCSRSLLRSWYAISSLWGKERRRRLIERLNEKEKLIGPLSPTPRGQMTEEELAAEIEKQRVLNAARRGFTF
jgi:hypothetical protein